MLRTGFDPSSVDRGRFARGYAGGATVAELAADFDLTPHQATVAIRSSGLPARLPVTHRRLSITDRQLSALVAAGHSDADIAARYDVAVWAVAQRRRRSGLRRPNHPAQPVGRARLERQLAAGRTRAAIATTHHVGLATVTRWCAHYGIDVVGPARPPGGRGVELDPRELRRWYVDGRWSADQIASHLGVDATLITFALHSHRIPVRHGGSGAHAAAVVLLDALYADPDVVAVLERHQIPLRRRGGRLVRRFPRPAPLDAALDAALADELYRQLGLSTTHVSLLTGHSASNVCEVLRHHGTPTRPSGRSPWYQRTVLSTSSTPAPA